mgnify:CR=1 FL=1
MQPVTPGKTYELKWKAKSQAEKQTYVVGVECYDAEKNLIVFENRFEQFTANPGWESFTFPLGMFDEEIRYVKVILCAANRTYHGEDKGVVWFDDLSMNQKETDRICSHAEILKWIWTRSTSSWISLISKRLPEILCASL